jgi:hypothetical protein
MKECYICKRKLLGRFEKDHFPKPKRAGGKDVYPICISCHDAKDRMSLRSWDIDEAFKSMHNLWNNGTTEERILLAKIISLACDVTDEQESAEATRALLPHQFELFDKMAKNKG